MTIRTSEILLSMGIGAALALAFVSILAPKNQVEATPLLPCAKPVFVRSHSGDGWQTTTYRCEDGSLLTREQFVPITEEESQK
jgi:hypothetical protein